MGDYIDGEAGDDTLSGGDGDDSLEGDGGNDILTGGAGVDLFVYNGTADGVDTITDFEVGVDKIQVSAGGFGGGLVAGGAVTFIAGSDPVGAADGGVFLYDTDDGRLWFDFDGDDGIGPGIHLATLIGAPNINADNFLVSA